MASLAQLRALGLSYDEVEGAVRKGWLHRLHRGVYAVGHRNTGPHGKLAAALLACGPTAFLSHRTAAAVWGLRGLSTRSIELTVPGSTRRHPRLTVHRTATLPEPADLASRSGLRASSVARLLIELAAAEKQSELDRLIMQCVRKRILDLEAIEAALARHARRPGVARLKQALRAYRPHRDRHSDLERAFDKLIAGTVVPPPQTNVVIDGWELDCYWPEAALVVELDGRDYHTAVGDMEKDKYKDSRLLLQGIRTMRVTELRLELEPHRVLADVIALTT